MSVTHGKQFTLYGSPTGPNPWKVAIILEELGLEYNNIRLDLQKSISPTPPPLFSNTNSLPDEQKQAPFTTLNPNGRVPALVDHSNNDFTIWESGAIILYLVGKYDKDHKISFPDFDTTAIANQYLMFQMSGSSPPPLPLYPTNKPQAKDPTSVNSAGSRSTTPKRSPAPSSATQRR